MTQAESQDKLYQTIDSIEASYEYMLAYAAQGRDYENSGHPSIRSFLTELDKGLEVIAYAFAEKIEAFDPGTPARKALDEFKHVLGVDAESAQKAVRLVLSVPSISSQLVDNLNASVHLRGLLTDVFVLDEALKLHLRASAVQAV